VKTKVGWTPLTIVEGVFYGAQFKENRESAALLRRLMANGPSKGATAQASPKREGGVPTFQIDPAWPKVPAKWKLGFVSSVAVDAQDHVWVLHRPRTLSATEKAMAAPPVLEFDAAGNFLQAWGGPGDGYEWPEREHGIYVDDWGNVWIGGNNYPARRDPGLKRVSDDQLLKFMKTGKLVMQVGRSNKSSGNSDTKNMQQPADAFVYRKTNEVFIADGYGNHRVIVLDANTGTFKRMWGAFGNMPLDTPPKGPEVKPPVIPDDGSPGPQQFDIVHAIHVSNDGLVYVADREIKRVQVFTIDGKFVTQKFIRRNEVSEARTTSGLAFSPDPQQQFLYLAGFTGASPQVVVLNRKTLEVVGSFGRTEGFTGGHHIATDSKGNIYAAIGNSPQKFVVNALSFAPNK
jgi:hypothetical protein